MVRTFELNMIKDLIHYEYFVFHIYFAQMDDYYMTEFILKIKAFRY